jgi:hypothetical protein
VARIGNLAVLKWLHSAGCPWDKETCNVAAKKGNLEMLQWVIDHGCPEPVNDTDYDNSKNRLLRM